MLWQSHLVVVAYEVYLVGAAVGCPATPVIDHVIEYVVMAVVIAGRIESTADAVVASLIVCQQVVVIGAHAER